jgi:AcrR family transcriptional regulator
VVKQRPDLQARRRAATRKRIVDAGTHLFESRGYAETSIRDIAAEAEVAVRTIYLHFDSKAAILLAYFDEWVDDFVTAICQSPPDAPIESAVARAYEILDAEGRVDHRTFDEMEATHPIVELFASSNLDIPGHVLQSWVRAQDRLTDHFAHADAAAQSPLLPRAKAAAVFAAWMVTLLAYRDARDGTRPATGPLDEFVFETLTRYGKGL